MNVSSRLFSRAVIALGRSLGLKVLAEGIEQAEQAKLLLQLGCNHAHGYFFGRPQPAEQLSCRWQLCTGSPSLI